MCSVEGCIAPAIAKGLCAKHYMRQRTHGRADVVKKRGRKPNKLKTDVRQFMSENQQSQSTFERYWRAFKILQSSGASAKERERVVMSAARPNGSVNTSKLLHDAWALYLDKKGR